MLGWALATAGQVAEARAVLQELRSRPAPAPTVVSEAWLLAALGESDAAFGVLERALAECQAALELAGLPGFDPLRDDPRFSACPPGDSPGRKRERGTGNREQGTGKGEQGAGTPAALSVGRKFEPPFSESDVPDLIAGWTFRRKVLDQPAAVGCSGIGAPLNGEGFIMAARCDLVGRGVRLPLCLVAVAALGLLGCGVLMLITRIRDWNVKSFHRWRFPVCASVG
jgi:hypothetical protein